MKKQILGFLGLIAASFCSITTASAQDSQEEGFLNRAYFEADAGLNFSKIRNLYSGSILIDHRVGATMGLPIYKDLLVARLGVYSSGKGEGLKKTPLPESAFKIWSLDFPITMATEMMVLPNCRLAVEAGVYLSVGLMARYTYPDAPSQTLYPKEAVGAKNRFDSGFTSRGSIYYGPYKLSIGGDLGWADLNRYRSDAGKAMTRSLFFTLGYRF